MSSMQHSTLFLIFLLILVVLLVSSEQYIHFQEYCEWESFNASCSSQEVILIRSARYGRMKVGRCVTHNYGNIGCGTDVSADFDRVCSGRRTCVIGVITLYERRSCPKDFTSYLEAAYECLKFSRSATDDDCTTLPTMATTTTMTYSDVTSSSSSTLQLVASSGTISSLSSPLSCPWTVTVGAHQRVNVTMVDFTASLLSTSASETGGVLGAGLQQRPQTSSSGNNNGSSGTTTGNCLQYAIITELPVKDDDLKGGTTTSKGLIGDIGSDSSSGRLSVICGGLKREMSVFLSRSNRIQIQITSRLPFLLKYDAFGCPPVEAPSSAWTRTSGQHAMVQCNGSSEAWYLTCRGTRWVGQVGNCSAMFYSKVEEEWMPSGVFGNVGRFPLGLLVVVALGVAIGVAVGVLMLVSLLTYIRRRRLNSKIFIHGSNCRPKQLSAGQAIEPDNMADIDLGQPEVQIFHDDNPDTRSSLELPHCASDPTKTYNNSPSTCGEGRHLAKGSCFYGLVRPCSLSLTYDRRPVADTLPRSSSTWWSGVNINDVITSPSTTTTTDAAKESRDYLDVDDDVDVMTRSSLTSSRSVTKGGQASVKSILKRTFSMSPSGERDDNFRREAFKNVPPFKCGGTVERAWCSSEHGSHDAAMTLGQCRRGCRRGCRGGCRGEYRGGLCPGGCRPSDRVYWCGGGTGRGPGGPSSATEGSEGGWQAGRGDGGGREGGPCPYYVRSDVVPNQSAGRLLHERTSKDDDDDPDVVRNCVLCQADTFLPPRLSLLTSMNDQMYCDQQ